MSLILKSGGGVHLAQVNEEGCLHVCNPHCMADVFKTGQFTRMGNAALWIPCSGKKFRLLKYMIESTLNTSQASQGILTVSFQDGTSPMSLAHDIYIQSPSLKYNLGILTRWMARAHPESPWT